MAWQRTPVLLLGESLCTEEPGGLQSMGLQRVGHDRVTNTDTQGELSDWTAKNTEAYCLTFGEAESLKSRNQEDHDL